ncbi:MAG: ABC transporter transmembrane domain-containing protein [Gemmatimonadota bacterium]|nr:ABC transporter transmembrane domain-containing protein [Gemmatimonadota bacterium]
MTPDSQVGARSSTRVLAAIRRYRKWLGLAVVLSAVGAALDAFTILLLIPFLRSLFDMGPLFPDGGRNTAERLIDGLVGGFLGDAQGLEALRVVCLIVVAILILKNLCLYASNVLSIRVEESLVRDLRNRLQARLQRLPLAFFGEGRAGQLIARVESDTREAGLIPAGILLGVRHTASTIAHVVALFFLSWRLALLALVMIPIIVLAMRPILRRLRAGFRRVFQDRGDVTSALQETISGIRLVKASGAEDFEARRFAARSEGFARAAIRSRMTAALASPLSEVLSSIGAVALVWIGAGIVLGSGGLGPDQFLAFVTLALRTVSPVKALSQVPSRIQQGLAAADRFLEVLDRETEPDEGREVAMGFEREIRFHGVTFSYGTDQPVLHDIDLTIRRGEIVAIVGPSGSGKSTLVDLVMRFADPRAGSISLDGTDLRDLTLSSLRALVGLVGQETVVFHDTAAANIAYGREGATPEEIRRAAAAAHADEFIDALPEGYDTVLGDRGTRLSGGQRQRIGIARAVLRDAPILILDEATSALDAESERHVREALTELFRDRTAVVVGHRLSTVREADRIVVLEAGRIVDEGIHQDLIARAGPYLDLFRQQLEPASV